MPGEPYMISMSAKSVVRQMSVERRGLCFERLEARELMAFDPTPQEQHLLELTNRFRINPAAELALLTTSLGTPARSSDPDVDSALRFFRTSGPTLQSQWASLTAAAPLAWNQDLYEAAEFHSQAMITADAQEHQLPGEPDLGDRITNAGYTNWSTAGESIFAFTRSVIHAHAGFLLDWGDTSTGIQEPPGHRNSAINPQFRETGIRILTPGLRAGKSTGPWVVTQDFGRRFSQTQAYLLGVAFGDSDSDGFYSAGEGFGGVSVIVSGTGGNFQTTTMSAGGWQINVPNGTYNVTFSGAGFGSAVTYTNVVVSSQNVKLDGVRGARPPAPDIAVSGNGVALTDGDFEPDVNDFTGFGQVNVNISTRERTFIVSNSGTQALLLSGTQRVVIAGTHAGEFTLLQDLPTSIAPGGSAQFRVRFSPTATGLRTASISVTSNDPDTSVFNFSIQGRGVRKPVTQVLGNASVIASGDSTPSPTDHTTFGQVAFPGDSRVRTYVVRNVGIGTMNLSATIAAVPGFESDTGAYSIESLSSTTVAPGDFATLTVRFSPTAATTQSVMIRIDSNDLATPFTFRVKGTGNPVARLAVLGGGLAIANGATTTSTSNRTDFGSIVAASGATSRVYAIRNVGVSALVLSGTPRVVITGPNAEAFSVTVLPATTIAAGTRSTFRVRFDPAALGVNSATVSVVSNDPLVPSYSFVITGTGA